MIDTILIPEDRIGVIQHRKTREDIEKKANVRISFRDNTVILDGEGLQLYLAKNIAKAIGRGFSPPKAFRLFKEDESLEIISMDYSPNRLKKVKSRIIGAKGKTRREIELYTKASVSVYGKTIALIGTYEQIKNARGAIEMLIGGSAHKTVYDFLRKL